MARSKTRTPIWRPAPCKKTAACRWTTHAWLYSYIHIHNIYRAGQKFGRRDNWKFPWIYSPIFFHRWFHSLHSDSNPRIFSFVRSFDFHFILNGFLCSFCCFFFSFHTQFVDTFLYRHRFHAHVLNLSILRHCHTQTFDRCWVYVPLFLYLSLSLSLLSSLFLSVSMSIKRAARSRVRSRLLRSRTSSFLEINFLIIYIEGGDEVNCKPVEELLSTFCSYYHRRFLRRAWKGLMHPFLFPFSFFFVSHARWESQIEQPDCVLNCRLSLWSSPDIRGS